MDLGLRPRVVDRPLCRLRGLFSLSLRNVELPLYRCCFDNTGSLESIPI
jgi:hypothetical protein